MRRALAATVLAVVALVLLAGPASAHASLDATTPSAGAVVASAPEELVLRFNQRVTARDDSVRLHDGDGELVPIGDLQREDDGRTLRAAVDDLDDGGYVVTFRVVSEDGHPINGGVTWRIGSSSPAVDQGLLEELLNAEQGSTSVRAAAALVRALLFASLLVLVGGLLFLVAVWPAGADDQRLRRTLHVAAAVGALTTVAGMGLQGADEAGAGLGRALSIGTALDTLDTDVGRAALARLVLLAVLAVVASMATPRRARSAGWRIVTLVASAATLLTLSLAGHARTGRWLPVAVPVDLVHLGAAAVWIGGLLVVAVVVLPRRGGEPEGGAVVARFSSVATVAVGAVVVTGTVQGLRQVGELEGLRTTSYGRLLVVKVVLVALVAVLGALSRSLVRARSAPVGPEGEPVAPDELRRSLRRSVGAEVAIAAVVLAVTSLLVAADPGRGEDDTAVVESKVVDGTIIEVQAAPARPGPVDIHVYVTDPTLGLTVQMEVTADLSLPGGDIEGIEIPVLPAGRGHWSAFDVDIPIAGDWRIDVVVAIDRFDQRRASFEVPIG